MRKIYWFIFTFFLFSEISFSQKNANQDSLNFYLKRADEKVTAGEWLAATQFYVRAQRFAESLDNACALCAIHCGFAKIAATNENNNDLRQAAQLAEKYCRTCPDTLNLGRSWMYRGVLFFKIGQMDSSATCFERAAELFLSQKDSLRAATALAKVGNVREGQGKYREALDFYLKYYAVPQVQADDFFRMNANIWLAGNYIYLERGAEAMPFTLEARRLAQKLGSKYEFGVTLEYEAKALSMMKQPQKAFDVMQHYAKYYRDTLIPSEQVAQMENLKTEYETEKKEAQIALQNAELTNQKRTIWGIGSILALVLVGGFFLFRLNQKLNKRNREKEFLIKEIHHRVKNNLQVLSSLLHLQSRGIKDETALDAVREGQNRVDAMGLIHQKLYMGENLAAVEMQDYLKNLGDTLLDSFGLDERVKNQISTRPAAPRR